MRVSVHVYRKELVMKKTALIISVFVGLSWAQELPDAKKLVDRADQNRRGKTSYGEMTMTVIRPSWSRSVRMKYWSRGTAYSLILITAPAKEKGQAFLKRKNEMWNWVPSINRLIKLPPSMMAQSWMGSDFTNDDLLKESSLVDDYTHTILGTDTIHDTACWKLNSIPKADAAVVWGKMLIWITKKGEHIIRTERYDEDGELMSTESASELKKMDDRVIPTKVEIVPADEQGHRTVLTIHTQTFNDPIKETFFSQQNMKRLR